MAKDAYTLILEAIEAGVYKPGDRLVESDLADRFGVSRTPVREALQRMETQAMLTRDGRSLIVASLDHNQLAELYAVRTELEGLAARLAAGPKQRYGVRFLFVPGTIGAIAWLARNEATVHKIKHGLVLTGLGDAGPLIYKQTKRAGAKLDRVATHVLKHWPTPSRIIPFDPYGYDERQYGSPGFNLGVGRLTRTPHGTFKEYHTSGDNLSFVQPNQLVDALAAIATMLDVLDRDRTYLNQNPKGEPRLGKRGLYRAVAGQAERQAQEMALLWTLTYSDGQDSLLEIAERAQRPFAEIATAAEALVNAGLLRERQAN
jgi:aminopeptidase-like protein